MQQDERADEEPEEEGVASETPKGRRSFARMRRELTDEELKSPGVQKILLDETERLESDCAALRLYVDRFYAADKERAILAEKLKPQTATDIFSGGALAVGSAMVGYAPGAWGHGSVGWLALVFGGLLVVSSVIAKVVSK